MTHEELDLDKMIENLEHSPSSIFEREYILGLAKIILEIKEGFECQFYFGKEDF
jgi:hypothetical protein